MAKLYFRYSTMNAGKSIDLLKVSYNYEESGKNTLCLTSAKDDRYGVGKITSRIGLSKDAIAVDDDMNIFELVENQENDVDCVLVDEAQFLTKKQIFELADIVDKLDVPVICYGLRSDFQMEGFPASVALMTISDTIEELKTICSECGEKKAIINARYVKNNFLYKKDIVEDGDQVMVGGNDSYMPLCRKCFKYMVDTKNKILKKDESVIPEGSYCYVPKSYKDGVLNIELCPYFDYRVFEDEKGKINLPYCHFLEAGSIPSNGWDNNEHERLKEILKIKDDDELFELFPLDVLFDQCKECGINHGDDDDEEYANLN